MRLLSEWRKARGSAVGEEDGASGSGTEKDGASVGACSPATWPPARHGSSRGNKREGKEKMDGDQRGRG